MMLLIKKGLLNILKYYENSLTESEYVSPNSIRDPFTINSIDSLKTQKIRSKESNSRTELDV